MTQKSDEPRNSGGPGSREVEYRTWACDKLFALKNAEEARFQSLTTKATVQGSGLVVLLALLLPTIETPIRVLSLQWWGLMAGLLFTGLTIFAVLKARSVRSFPSMDPRQLMHKSVLEESVEDRLEEIGKKLTAEIRLTDRVLNQQAHWVSTVQYFAFAGAFSLLLAIVGGMLEESQDSIQEATQGQGAAQEERLRTNPQEESRKEEVEVAADA